MINVEFKSELRDIDLARAACAGIGALHAGVLEQTDTYFRIPDGRLKKRETVGEPTEWIFYDRENRSLPKLSRFTIYTEAMAKERFGTRPLPVWLVVRSGVSCGCTGVCGFILMRWNRLGGFWKLRRW